MQNLTKMFTLVYDETATY